MGDEEIFDVILSYLDLKKILSDNPEISNDELNRIISKLRDCLSKEQIIDRCIHLYVDGASRGNPGESGIGIIIKDEDGSVLEEDYEYIGINTNNVSEYKALIFALEKAKTLNPAKIKIYSDSKIVVNQIKGVYKVKNPALIELYWEAVNLLKNFKSWEIVLIAREENKRADILANMGIEKRVEKGV